MKNLFHTLYSISQINPSVKTFASTSCTVGF